MTKKDKEEMYKTIEEAKCFLLEKIEKSKENECCASSINRDFEKDTYLIVKNMGIDRKIKEHEDKIKQLEEEIKDRKTNIIYLEQSRYN